jgi:hypothetical protein
MKAAVPFKELMFFRNVPIRQVMCPLWPVKDDGHTTVSLWNARAFPMLHSKKQAEEWALWMLRRVQNWIVGNVEKGDSRKDADYPSRENEILGLVSLSTCMEICA